jgi:hypothetical protein
LSELATLGNAIPATTGKALANVTAVESRMRDLYAEHAAPDTTVTEHLLHGGMYARTVRVKAPQSFASVMITPPTVLIVNGSAKVYSGDHVYEIRGYRVIPASAGRKAIWIIEQDTEITAIFPTSAKTLDEAEREFTSEPGNLCPLCERDVVTITGVEPCQA